MARGQEEKGSHIKRKTGTGHENPIKLSQLERMSIAVSYLYYNCVEVEKESKPGMLIKNAAEVLRRDGCD